MTESGSRIEGEDRSRRRMGRGAQGEQDEEWVEEEGMEIEAEIEEGEGASVSGPLGIQFTGATSLDVDQDASEWTNFKHFPVATQGVFRACFNKLAEQGRAEFTILLLGKNGVGKSSTVNHLIGERKQKVNPYGVSTIDKPTVITRSVGIQPVAGGLLDMGSQDPINLYPDFHLTLIDTPGLVIGDRIHEATLNTVAEIAKVEPIDAVLFVDRLDVYDVSALDREVFEAVSRVLGAEIWGNTVLCLTHGELEPAKGQTYADAVSARAEGIQGAIARYSGGTRPEFAVIENSSKCARNWSSERILPDGTVALPNLIQRVTEVGLGSQPYEYDSRGKSPDSRNKWMVPLLFAAQVLLKKFLFDKAVRQWDTYHGDEWGPKEQEFKDDKYIAKMKEAKREYIRRQKAKQEAK